MTKRTLGGTNRKAIKVSGFRARMRDNKGKKISGSVYGHWPTQGINVIMCFIAYIKDDIVSK